MGLKPYVVLIAVSQRLCVVIVIRPAARSRTHQRLHHSELRIHCSRDKAMLSLSVAPSGTGCHRLFPAWLGVRESDQVDCTAERPSLGSKDVVKAEEAWAHLPQTGRVVEALLARMTRIVVLNPESANKPREQQIPSNLRSTTSFSPHLTSPAACVDICDKLLLLLKKKKIARVHSSLARPSASSSPWSNTPPKTTTRPPTSRVSPPNAPPAKPNPTRVAHSCGEPSDQQVWVKHSRSPSWTRYVADSAPSPALECADNLCRTGPIHLPSHAPHLHHTYTHLPPLSLYTH